MKYGFFILYLIVINILSAAVCAADKARARKGKWRVKERTLFLLCFLGGGPAMYLTMRAIRHKTLHKRFMVGIPLIVLAETALLLYFLLK